MYLSLTGIVKIVKIVVEVGLRGWPPRLVVKVVVKIVIIASLSASSVSIFDIFFFKRAISGQHFRTISMDKLIMIGFRYVCEICIA